MRRMVFMPGAQKWAVIGALWLWFAAVLVTHHGAASPYSYAGGVAGLPMERIGGLVVNLDAPQVQPVTQFFYDATPPDYREALLLKLPLHSFLVAAAAGFLRSYLLANFLVNLLALWLLSYVAVTLAESLAFSRAATLVASLTCAALPFYTNYIGQPMQYVTATAISFLVIMAVLAGVRDPLRLGILTAVLTLNYDPYVYLAALITWIAMEVRWTRVRDWLVYAAAALVPLILWRGFLELISAGTLSTKLQDQFVVPVLAGWMKVFTRPGANLLTPFVNGHVGFVNAFQMTVAMIYWPVLVAVVIAWRPRFSLPALLAVFFVAEQLVTAAYDWENHPRRAIPLMFAVSCAYFALVRDKLHLRGWRIAFAAILLSSVFIPFSDTLTRSPLAGYMISGGAMHDPTKDIASVARSRLSTSVYPKLMQDDSPRWWDIERARVAQPAVFVFTNVFTGAVLVALLFVLRERALLPRHFPTAVALLFLLSLGARFL